MGCSGSMPSLVSFVEGGELAAVLVGSDGLGDCSRVMTLG